MRICMLNDNFYRGSGVTQAIRRIIQSPPFAGIDVHFVGCEKISGRKSLQEDNTFIPEGHYHFFPMMDAIHVLLPTLLRFGHWLRKMKFDAVHVHHRRLAVLANILEPVSGVPVVFTGHLTFPNAAWFREFSPKRVTGVSPSVVDYLRRATRATELSLVYNPYAFEHSDAPIHEMDLRRAVAIGRLDPVKGFGTLIEAWSRLKKNGIDAQLDIFGEGPLRDSLADQIDRHDLQHNIALRGFASDVSQRLPNYAFNILVSEREGFPNAVVEAAAFGRASLLNDVDGSRDALPPCLSLPNGLPFGDVEALTSTLERWFASPDLLQLDGRRFHDFLKSRCSPDIVGRQYLATYAGLVGKPSARLRHEVRN
jgi:glycosyltransferase involved in cell wall biosynthesis